MVSKKRKPKYVTWEVKHSCGHTRVHTFGTQSGASKRFIEKMKKEPCSNCKTYQFGQIEPETGERR